MNQPATAPFDLTGPQTENSDIALPSEVVPAVRASHQAQSAVVTSSADFGLSVPQFIPVRPSYVNIDPVPTSVSGMVSLFPTVMPPLIPASQSSKFQPHVPTSRSSPPSKSADEIIPSSVYECILCRKLFPTSEDLIDHHEIDHTVDARLRKYVDSITILRHLRSTSSPRVLAVAFVLLTFKI